MGKQWPHCRGLQQPREGVWSSPQGRKEVPIGFKVSRREVSQLHLLYKIMPLRLAFPLLLPSPPPDVK